MVTFVRMLAFSFKHLCTTPSLSAAASMRNTFNGRTSFLWRSGHDGSNQRVLFTQSKPISFPLIEPLPCWVEQECRRHVPNHKLVNRSHRKFRCLVTAFDDGKRAKEDTANRRHAMLISPVTWPLTTVTHPPFLFRLKVLWFAVPRTGWRKACAKLSCSNAYFPPFFFHFCSQ